ncbi:MAG: phosphoribosyltransferase family protein [Patescibacteria group bacterium]
MKRPITIVPNDPFETLRLADGYYETPERDGKFFGPLVGYAGKYDAPDGSKKQKVGKAYLNFVRAEQEPALLRYYAQGIAEKLHRERISIDAFLGAPMGGIKLATVIADIMGVRSIFAEKVVTRVATESQREESKLVLGRYEIDKNDHIVIVEDVCNNFSTAAELIDLIRISQGFTAGIACAFNRSDNLRIVAHEPYMVVPVVSFAYKPTKQYTQEEPWVAEAIQTVGLVTKPKHEWQRLEEAMRLFRKNTL